MNNDLKEKQANDDISRLAAYALNLCTVSVSQIVDYNDPVIMEQEYDAIINNLNLQNMPKEDESLLDILEKLMDTITFFRINEKEKQMVERDYQEKMKNSVWEAVPNFGMIVSGEPITMAISLATQVGIGYMNYRRAKAENTLQYERERWQLERAAIEQINSLRRQLFDAAWKMARTYGYEDKYRLSERQIKQYNNILMDSDIGRKFERLESIKNNFEAYPPFWYNLGNAANQLHSYYENLQVEYAEEISNEYKVIACEAYEKYITCITYNLLREDPIKSACCLEYVDLLDCKKDAEKMKELVSIAICCSGGRQDIMQLCAFSYLKIGMTDEAKTILKQLVNEGYNSIMNGQLLSKIYVSEYLNCSDEKELSKIVIYYNLLAQRVNEDYLYKLPINHKRDWNQVVLEFENKQKEILIQNYFYALKAYFEKCNIQFNKCVPIWSEQASEYDFPEIAYTDSDVGRKYRINQAEKAFRKNPSYYCMELLESEFWKRYLVLFNDMASSLNNFSGVYDISLATEQIRNSIEKNRNQINELVEKLFSNKFGINDYSILQSINFYSLCNGFMKEICKQILSFTKQLPQQIARDNEFTLNDAEAELRSFCLKMNLEEPEELYKTQKDVKKSQLKFFTDEMWGNVSVSWQNDNKLMQELVEAAEQNRNEILVPTKKSQISIILKNDPNFKSYFSKLKNGSTILPKSFMVIDDRSFSDKDLVFTTDGIYPISGKIVKPAVTEYDDNRIAERLNDNKLWIDMMNSLDLNPVNIALHTGISLTTGIVGEAIYSGVRAAKGDYYDNKEINVIKLYELICKFSEILLKYNICSDEKVHYFDKIFDSIYREEVVKSIQDTKVDYILKSYGESIAEFDVRYVSRYLAGTIAKGKFAVGDEVIGVHSDGSTYEAKIIGYGGSNEVIEDCNVGDNLWLKIDKETQVKSTIKIIKC